MTLRHFIDRPVLASVISIVIVIAGIIGLSTLPIEQYPNIAPPTVMVRASYPGASAETIQKSVIVPLEEAINGVENMMYIQSEASNAGSASITVYFRQGTDPDMAAVNVQNRVATATGQLPGEVTQIGITTMKRQTSMLKVFTVSSPDDTYDEGFLSNYVKINIEPRIQRIQGVGEFFVLGADYSMRVWLKPDVMAQHKLVPSDVTAVLAEQNIESAAGTLGENSDNTFQYTMKYRGRLVTPEEFGNIVIRSQEDGTILRLKDIAEVEMGDESYAYHGQVNGHPGVTAMVFQTAGTNATQIVKDVDALLDEIRAELPKGVVITDLMSVNEIQQVADAYGKGTPQYIDCLLAGAKAYPQDITAQNNAALALIEAGRTEEAVALLQKAPQDAALQNMLGVAYLKQGNTEDARSMFRQAASAGNAQAQANLKMLEDYIEYYAE